VNIEAGHILSGGSIELKGPIGQGGMGSVWRGWHHPLERAVAVKFLLSDPDGALAPQAAARLRDEASAAAEIDHPNVVFIIEAGEDPAFGPYIVYEFLEGGSLAEEIANRGRLPWDEVIDGPGRCLLEALSVLHEASIVHRDVKPDNLFKAAPRLYKLGDLGLAVFADREAKTQEGAFLGTPGFLPPERITNPDSPETARGDIYSAAVLIVQATTGQLPFSGNSAAALLKSQMTHVPTPSTLQTLGMPAHAAKVLSSCLERDPSLRPRSAKEMLKKLQAHASSTQQQVLPQTRSAIQAASPVQFIPPSKLPRAALLVSLVLAACLLATTFMNSTNSYRRGAVSLHAANLDPLFGHERVDELRGLGNKVAWNIAWQVLERVRQLRSSPPDNITTTDCRRTLQRLATTLDPSPLGPLIEFHLQRKASGDRLAVQSQGQRLKTAFRRLVVLDEGQDARSDGLELAAHTIVEYGLLLRRNPKFIHQLLADYERCLINGYRLLSRLEWTSATGPRLRVLHIALELAQAFELQTAPGIDSKHLKVALATLLHHPELTPNHPVKATIDAAHLELGSSMDTLPDVDEVIKKLNDSRSYIHRWFRYYGQLLRCSADDLPTKELSTFSRFSFQAACLATIPKPDNDTRIASILVDASKLASKIGRRLYQTEVATAEALEINPSTTSTQLVWLGPLQRSRMTGRAFVVTRQLIDAARAPADDKLPDEASYMAQFKTAETYRCLLDCAAYFILPDSNNLAYLDLIEKQTTPWLLESRVLWKIVNLQCNSPLPQLCAARLARLEHTANGKESWQACKRALEECCSLVCPALGGELSRGRLLLLEEGLHLTKDVCQSPEFRTIIVDELAACENLGKTLHSTPGFAEEAQEVSAACATIRDDMRDLNFPVGKRR